MHRQRKEIDSDDWAQLGERPDGKMVNSAGRLFMVLKDDWYWVGVSPKYDKENIDTLIRFQHERFRKGSGGMAFADGEFAEVFCGEARCHDEGDLLVASRMSSFSAKAMIDHEDTKAALEIGSPMPEIQGESAGTVEWSGVTDLEGKVVLVDFWATWCNPCVKKLPDVNALQQKFGEDGLVVVGVHSSQNAGQLPEFLEDNPLQFPVVLDDGKTEKSFAVTQYPTYFLVGRDGKIVSAFQSSPPSEEAIEAELEK